jgi:hypothetical protein
VSCVLVSFFSLARCSNSKQMVSGVFNLVMKIQDSVEDRAGEVAELTMGHFGCRKLYLLIKPVYMD